MPMGYNTIENQVITIYGSFHGAFFPQFITMDHYFGTQIAILSVTFLAIAVLVDGGWALIAGHVRGLLASRPWPRSLFFSAPLCRLP